MAELTCPAVKESESSVVARQLASMQDELKQATAKWDKLLDNTSAGVSDEPILLAQGAKPPDGLLHVPPSLQRGQHLGENLLEVLLEDSVFPRDFRGQDISSPLLATVVAVQRMLILITVRQLIKTVIIAVNEGTLL